jgi:hypothetical protein
MATTKGDLPTKTCSKLLWRNEVDYVVVLAAATIVSNCAFVPLPSVTGLRGLFLSELKFLIERRQSLAVLAQYLCALAE